jgi:hypothetical protein
MLNTIDITFEFEFGLIDGRAMLIEVVANNDTLRVDHNNPKIVLSQITIPNKIEIKFSGKNLKHDTKIDQLGNIIQDMYVKIIGMKIDNLKIPDWVIQKKLSYTTDAGKELQTAYIGFNGIMTMLIPENNVFAFYRRLNHDA